MMDVTIHKHRLTGDFTQYANKLVKDTRLSCEAYRLLSWILSFPPNKKHSFDEWQEVIHAGRDKLKAVLAELEKYGYASISKNKRDAFGRFGRSTYEFYDYPDIKEQNPQQEPSQQKSPHQEGFNRDWNPVTGETADNNVYNTSSNSFCVSMSCLSNPEAEKTENVETVETVEMPVENPESNEDLTNCITSSLNEIIAENAELKEKLSLVPDMHEFMQNLTDTIKTALLRLKHPEARGKFIKNTITHILEKIKAKKSVSTPKPEKPVKKADNPTPYTHTLALIGSQLSIDEEDPDCENIEYLYNYPLSIMQEDIQNCTLPYSLQDDKKALRDAIQYVTGYCYDRYEHGYKEAQKDYAFRHFVDAVVDALTEIITTERVGKRVVHYYEYIDKINRIIRIDGSLYGFVVDFEYYFRRLLETKDNEGEPVRNKKRYLNAVLSDFLMSYNANQITPTWCGEIY